MKKGNRVDIRENGRRDGQRVEQVRGRLCKPLFCLCTVTVFGAFSVRPAYAETKAEKVNEIEEGYGAELPYTRYEAEEGIGFSGAVLKNLREYNGEKEENRENAKLESDAMEASNQAYVVLPKKDSAIRFTMTKPADAVDIRYTVPENKRADVEILLQKKGEKNWESLQTVQLDGSRAWQYIRENKAYDTKVSGSHARFRFDETHFLLKKNTGERVHLEEGDVLAIRNKGEGNAVPGIDFIETEEAGDAKERPENSISVTDAPFNAKANDGKDDSKAFEDALKQAVSEKKELYIPEGQFDFDRRLVFDAREVKISGAGIWYTKLHFKSTEKGGGGMEFANSSKNVELSDFYMDSALSSRYDEKANYKGICGVIQEDSHLHDLWIEHFECGAWIGDYKPEEAMQYTSNMRIEACRIRNNLADGVNFAQGTKYSTVENSDIRGNGDDGLATWASKAHLYDKDGNIVGETNAKSTEHNSFKNNTVELIWRAAGIAIHGGKDHLVEGNLVKDIFSGSGIRVTTTFDGYTFQENDPKDGESHGIEIRNNLLLRTGTSNDFYGNALSSIHFEKVNGAIRNVHVENNRIVEPFQGDFSANFYIEGTKEENTIFESNNPIERVDLDRLEEEEERLFQEREENAEREETASNQENVEEEDNLPENLRGKNVEMHDRAEIRPDANFKLYWWQKDVKNRDGSVTRYWVKKLEGIHLDDTMEYSEEDGTKVFNFMPTDIPEYIPITGTAFVEDYHYEGEDWIRWEHDGQVEYAKIRYWSKK